MGRAYCRGCPGQKEEADGQSPEDEPDFRGSFEFVWNLCFYTGDFGTAKQASKNPSGSLGWSSSFIDHGIWLFLLYLFENSKPSQAAAMAAQKVGFADDAVSYNAMHFESAIAEESRKLKVSTFWNYFQRWKQYFPMGEDERKNILHGQKKLCTKGRMPSSADSIRSHYQEVAVLLALTAENKESMGIQGARTEIFAEYKKKFPKHSSFQREMKKQMPPSMELSAFCVYI